MLTELEVFRHRKDNFFRDDANSPLTPDQKRHFAGLHYYPENPSLKLWVRVEAEADAGFIEIDTSTGQRQRYERAGSVKFDLSGQAIVLHLYSHGDPHRLFLPFRDATSGKETYAAGRYLDLELEADGTVLLDFNYAYNPYCAYNELWTCPLTPVENTLPVPIEAGETTYK